MASRYGTSDGMDAVVARQWAMCFSRSRGVVPGKMLGLLEAAILSEAATLAWLTGIAAGCEEDATWDSVHEAVVDVVTRVCVGTRTFACGCG